MDTSSTHGSPTDPDLARMLSLAEGERARASALLQPNLALIYAAWGLAWLVGPGLMWLAVTRDVLPVAVAGIVYALALAAAAVTTAVHTGRRATGISGVSQRVGAMYGWSWFLGFAALVAIMWSVTSAGASEELLRILWVALSCLVVGVLYLAAGALWQDVVQYAIGAWILVVGAAGALLGSPANLLVMSLAGGGVFLAGAAVSALRRSA